MQTLYQIGTFGNRISEANNMNMHILGVSETDGQTLATQGEVIMYSLTLDEIIQG